MKISMYDVVKRVYSISSIYINDHFKEPKENLEELRFSTQRHFESCVERESYRAPTLPFVL